MWKAGGHSAAEHRPPGEAVGGELGPLVVVEVEGVESLADGAVVYVRRGAPRGRLCMCMCLYLYLCMFGTCTLLPDV